MAFQDVPIVIDESELQDTAVNYLEDKVDGYVLDPAHPETWLIEAFSRLVAEAAFVAATPQPAALFRWAAEKLFNIPRQDGANAVGATTWTARDTTGYTIPAGTFLSIDDVPFSTDSLVTIAPGSSSTAAGEVLVTAVNPGVDGNALTDNCEPVDSLTWLSGIALVGTTAGGADAETDVEFQDRASALLQLQSWAPITADDFALATLQFDGVYRATAIDDTAGGVSIAAIDSTGAAIGAALKLAIAADLESKRELNFTVTMIDPTFTTITVNYAVVKTTGYNAATVKTAVDAALTDYLHATTWGLPQSGETLDWINTPVVRYLQVARVIENVSGVDHITTLTLNTTTADVTMAGDAPLPTLVLNAARTVT